MFRQFTKNLFKLGTKKVVKETVKLPDEDSHQDRGSSRSSSFAALASSLSFSSLDNNNDTTMVANYSLMFDGISF